MDRVLFLDFDGCLHSSVQSSPAEDRFPFAWLDHLVDAMAGHADVGVVVHSTWRYIYDHAEIEEMLGPLGPKFLSTTPRGPRQESIMLWLHMHPQILDYRVVDDDPMEFDEEIAEKLILCPPAEGLRDPAVRAQLTAWLGPR